MRIPAPVVDQHTQGGDHGGDENGIDRHAAFVDAEQRFRRVPCWARPNSIRLLQ